MAGEPVKKRPGRLIRAFTGIACDAPDSLTRLQRELRDLIAPVPPDNFHITLRFLGDIDADAVPAIARGLREVLAGTGPFELALRGLGTFPSASRAKVAWAGVHDLAGVDEASRRPLAGIVERVDALLQRLGYPIESRPYVPHVTLARNNRRAPVDLTQLVSKYEAFPLATIEVSRVSLYQSVPHEGGSHYRVLDSAVL